MDGTDPLDVSPSHGLTVTVTVTVTRSELHASRMSVLAAHEPFVRLHTRYEGSELGNYLKRYLSYARGTDIPVLSVFDSFIPTQAFVSYLPPVTTLY